MQKSTTFFNNDFLYELVLEIMTSLVLFAKKCVKPKIDLKGQYTANVLVVKFTGFSRGSVSAVVQL